MVEVHVIRVVRAKEAEQRGLQLNLTVSLLLLVLIFSLSWVQRPVTGTTCIQFLFIYSIVRYITNTTLTNIWGQEKSVIQLAGENEAFYQYIPHAVCP